MALFRYFKREKGNLPDPHGPLARSVPSTSIAVANSEVSTAIDTASRNSGKYSNSKNIVGVTSFSLAF